MSNTDNPPGVPVSDVDQAEFLVSQRRKSMDPDPGAGPKVRCPRCRTEMRWDDLTKHMVMKEGDSAYRHCSNSDCSSIFSLQEGKDALVLHCSDRKPEPKPEIEGNPPQHGPGPDGEKGCPEKELYETPSLTEINLGAADALVAHHAKETAINLVRFANSAVLAIGSVKDPDAVGDLLNACEHALKLAHQADVLGDKAIVRMSILKETADCTHAIDPTIGVDSVLCENCGKYKSKPQAIDVEGQTAPVVG